MAEIAVDKLSWKTIQSLNLEVWATCWYCKKTLKLKKGQSYFPTHGDEKRCEGSGNGGDDEHYPITSLKQAKRLAMLLANDDGKCLQGGFYHNMNCADGNRCDEVRRMLAKALADFFLARTEKAKKKVG